MREEFLCRTSFLGCLSGFKKPKRINFRVYKIKSHLTAAPYVVNVRSSIIVMMSSVESCRMKSSYYIELTRQGQTRRLLGRTWLKGVSEARLQDFDCKSPNVQATNVEQKKQLGIPGKNAKQAKIVSPSVRVNWMFVPLLTTWRCFSSFSSQFVWNYARWESFFSKHLLKYL